MVKGSIYILKLASNQAPETYIYSIIFSPVRPEGTGGEIPGKDVREKEDVVKFLRGIGLNRDKLQNALKELETDGTASMLVDLRKDELRDLHLMPVP
jgi:hypothetical protein